MDATANDNDNDDGGENDEGDPEGFQLFVAREFLTWMAHHAEVAGGEFTSDVHGRFIVTFGGKVSLRTQAGQVTAVLLSGPSPLGSADLRYALAGGFAVSEADLFAQLGDRQWTFALAAEHLDLRRVKLPALLTEKDDDRADERVQLLDQLDELVRSAFTTFLRLRAGAAWRAEVVPALRAWLDEGT